MKGSKGSASLNRNENANQTATCYTCGITIRYILRWLLVHILFINRGPYISAIGRCYCVDHFTCSKCSVNLIECGFVEENGKLYCESDFEQFLAPHCAKCSQSILKVMIDMMKQSIFQ